MQVEASRLEQIITDCCTEFAENGSTLLVNDGEYLYSASLLRRMGKVDDISNLRREAAQKRWKNQPCKADDGSGASTSNANAEQTDANKRKAKQRKRKQRKLSLRTSPPATLTCFPLCKTSRRCGTGSKSR